MDLRQLCWGNTQWGCRRLIAHIIGIPPHISALARKRLGDSAPWSINTELQATTVDAINLLSRTMVQVMGGKTEGELQRIPRPFDTELPSEPEEAVGLAQFADFLKGPNL